MNHCTFSIVKIEPDRVFIIDLDDGGLSVTNDAEAVCEELSRIHPGKRIIYRDTDGRWDELVHQNGVFKGFAPYKNQIPFDHENYR